MQSKVQIESKASSTEPPVRMRRSWHSRGDSNVSAQTKTGSYDQALFDQKIETLTKDWQKFIQIQQTAEVVDLAVLLAKQLALRGADAIHLASAHVLQTRLHSQNDVLHFVCSDRELLQAATTSGLTDIDPTMQSE